MALEHLGPIFVKFGQVLSTRRDLLPADVVGTQIYNPRSGEFSVKRGPVFANLVLADEINRATPKTQSSLLEAMQEHQVTVARSRYPLDQPFFVRFGGWIWALLHGDLGTSIFTNLPVTQLIAQRIEPTLSLMLLTIVFSIVVAIPLGVL